jgi:rubrerythrin
MSDDITLEVADNGGYELPILVCKRCGHLWSPKTNNLPKVCPKCKNPNWNKTKKKS